MSYRYDDDFDDGGGGGGGDIFHDYHIQTHLPTYLLTYLTTYLLTSTLPYPTYLVHRFHIASKHIYSRIQIQPSIDIEPLACTTA